MRLSFVLLSGLGLSAVLAAPEVQLGHSIIVGTDLAGVQQEFFGGIPYAEPPVSNLRFAPPVPRFELNVSNFDATNYGAACPQAGTNVSEDCLFVNILRPAGLSAQDRLPVMVWLYGGGFNAGDSSIYNASFFVARSVIRETPIIYVSLNYRLGPLGFPQGLEATAAGALNLGLKDQLVALQWVQANIGAFGGDKDQVTVFGESAGAISLNILMLNSSFSTLARAAILESGSASSIVLYDGTQRETYWQNFVKAVPECCDRLHNDTFACLRSANLTTILAAQSAASSFSEEEFPYVPVIDGSGGVLPDFPSRLWADGFFSRIPFIAGTNLDEGTAFIPTYFNSSYLIKQWIITNSTPSIFPMFKVKHVADEMLMLYPDDPALGSPFNTGNNTFGLSPEYKRASAIMGDIYFHSLRRLWMQNAADVGVDAWGYLFTDPQQTGALGVTHSTELNYVYGDVNSSASAESLSSNMIDYWLSFATSLDPNDMYGNTLRPRWTRYRRHNQKIIQLNGSNTTMIQDYFRHEQIRFINSNALVFRH